MHKVLVVVDMQNDFINGSLGTPEAQAIVPRVIEKIKNFKGNIYFTMDCHYDYYLSTQEGRRLPIKHCIDGTSGWNIPDEIRYAQPKSYSYRSYVLPKESFGYLNWEGAFRSDEVRLENLDDEIEIIGLCTDICVISNAMILKATCPDVRIVVDASCCAGTTPESHKRALEAMKMCQIDIINEEVEV